MKVKYLILLIILIAALPSYGQDFSIIKHGKRNVQTVRYYNQEAGIILQKTTNLETAEKPVYEIGLVITQSAHSSDDFMGPKAYVEFEDGSFIEIDEQPSYTYKQGAKNQLHVRHRISLDEHERLNKMAIKSFSIFGVKRSLDKWEKQKVLVAFQKLVTDAL